ncbi:hypothetical protein [Agromyces larvae]|uniref:Uncharacterized protein n=1 Tax=Agromyces larvae TaxID=2929802 RepID=A0ABY4BWM1_9MICO|nr:hypothetical protein [Agromyces larvae]UOE43626.1 hypothetical protein MTO99_15825 [Agromyces larvae]
MNWTVFTVAILIGAAAGSAVQLYRRSRMRGDRQITAVLAVANRVGLVVTTEALGDRIADRLRRQARITLLTLPLALTVGLLVALRIPADASTIFVALPVWVMVVAQQVATSIAAVVEGFRLDPDRPRVAMVRPRSRGDYSDAVVRVGVRVLAVLAGVVGLAAVLAQVEGAVAIGAAALIAIAGTFTADLLAESLARHPQHARDDDELRWDDALRALAVNDLYTGPFAVAALTAWAGGIQLLDIVPITWGWAGVAVVAAVPLLASATVIAAIVTGFTRRPAYRAVRRLWPEETRA